MEHKLKQFANKVSLTLGANLLAMVVSILTVLLIPKVIGLESYAYWQLYIFYSGYIAYLSLGITDGVYLRYGGLKYEELPKHNLKSQFIFLVFFELISSVLIVVAYFFISDNVEKNLVMGYSALVGMILVPRSLLLFLSQAINDIKTYAFATIIEKVTFIITVILIIIFNRQDFLYLIFADIFSKVISFIYLILKFKSIFLSSYSSISQTFKEIKVNISVGSKLLLANLSGILIIGITRFSVENKWNIEVFGKLSLSLSLLSLFMVLINSLSTVLFPTLRNISFEKMESIYMNSNKGLSIFTIGCLIFYYPFSLFFSLWLPDYAESLKFMILIFPLVIFESRTQLLSYTFLKVMRKENIMLVVNALVLMLGILLTFISVYVLNSLYLTILNITILLSIRSIILDIFLCRMFNMKLQKEWFFELLFSTSFILLYWSLDDSYAFLIFLLFYIGYLFYEKKTIFKFLTYSAYFNR